tara:strand:- start:2490 stop:3137 length:648 start_codon:yes stop_codon:yes gene_type:complete
MLAEIQQKILDILKENNFDVDSYDFQQIASGQMLILDRPAALIDSRNGSRDRETTKQTNMRAMITLTLVIYNVCQGIHVELAVSKLRDALITLLNHNQLGLDYLKNGLLYMNYNNVTSRGGARDLQLAGFHVDEITFLAEYPILEIPQPEDVDRGDLRRIVAQYFINDDSTPELEGVVDFTELNGGTAYAGEGVLIDGGSNVENQESPVYAGGNP